MPAPLRTRAVRYVRRHVAKRLRRAGSKTSDSDVRALERLFSPACPGAALARDGANSRARDGRNELADEPEDLEVLPPDLALASSVVGILAPRTAAILRELLPAKELVPGSRSIGAQVAPGSVFVVERAALQDGPWAGTESSVGTALALEIIEWMKDAHREDVPVVLLDSHAASNVGTNMMRAGADIVLPQPWPADVGLGRTPHSPVLAVLDQVARDATEGDR